jgi:dihydrofolate reductase
MAKLIYAVNSSLDGYTEDRDGDFNWGDPDEEYFGLVNDVERSVGTYLFGRRMYETMVFWETAPISELPPWQVEFTNLWRAANKIVYSKTLDSVSSERTTLEREFDIEAIRRMKAGAGHDLTVSGADLATQAFEAGLVDECHFFYWPVIVGGGKHALSTLGRHDFELLNERHTRNGVVHLHYGITH